jgi:hypothetical protein
VVHGLPLVVAAIVTASWAGAAVNNCANSGWTGIDTSWPILLVRRQILPLHTRCRGVAHHGQD